MSGISQLRGIVRDAVPGDVPALAALRHTAVMHRDRITNADGTTLRYLVVEIHGQPVGFGCLVLAQPRTWPKVGDLPQMLDLNIREDLRGYGLGSLLIASMEQILQTVGHPFVYLEVDPRGNPRAFALYRRLGYEPLSKHPVEDPWEFVDSDGVRDAGIDWIVRLRKRLPSSTRAGGG